MEEDQALRDQALRLFVFGVPNGCYTGGVSVSLGRSKEDAIARLIAKVQQSNEMDRLHDRHYRALHMAYDRTFVRRENVWGGDGGWAVKVEGADVPYEEEKIRFPWQLVWNALLPFPDNDDKRVIYEALHAALPDRMAFCNFGTSRDDIASFREALESCTEDNGGLMITLPVSQLEEFSIIQGGGD
jgi:hypothetical protein